MERVGLMQETPLVGLTSLVTSDMNSPSLMLRTSSEISLEEKTPSLPSSMMTTTSSVVDLVVSVASEALATLEAKERNRASTSQKLLKSPHSPDLVDLEASEILDLMTKMILAAFQDLAIWLAWEVA
jgi:hypothetical protein